MQIQQGTERQEGVTFRHTHLTQGGKVPGKGTPRHTALDIQDPHIPARASTKFHSVRAGTSAGFLDWLTAALGKRGCPSLYNNGHNPLPPGPWATSVPPTNSMSES